METVTSKGADEGKRLAFTVSKAKAFLSKPGSNFAEKVFFPFAEPRLWKRIDYRTSRRREGWSLAKSKGMCCALADHCVTSKGASDENRPLMVL